MRRVLSYIDRYSLALMGTVVLASLLPARGVFAEGLSLVTTAAIALLFFLHGAKLSREAVVAGLLHWRLHLIVLAATFVIFPLAGLALQPLAAVLLGSALAGGLLFLTLLPSTVQSSIAFTSMAGGNVPAAVCAASLSNILGVFLTPLLVAVLMSAGGKAGVSIDAIWKIMLQLLAPFVAGQLLQPWVGTWIRHHKALTTQVDRGSILLVVYGAFSASVVAGLWSQVSALDLGILIGLCCALLAFIIGLTTWIARRAGFCGADEAALVFCGSKKSLASGVPIAGAIFPAAQAGAILLPLMIFHQIQLLVCAVMAQRYAARQNNEPLEGLRQDAPA